MSDGPIRADGWHVKVYDGFGEYHLFGPFDTSEEAIRHGERRLQPGGLTDFWEERTEEPTR